MKKSIIIVIVALGINSLNAQVDPTTGLPPAPGSMGSTGITGTTGFTGTIGSTGYTGSTGSNGSMGITGNTGGTTPMGVPTPSPTGTQGVSGPTGTSLNNRQNKQAATSAGGVKNYLPVLKILAGNAISDRDREFINDAAEGNLMEVKLGQLAQTNGASDAVKQFGLQMVNDHTASGLELKALADKKGITLPAVISAKQQKMVDDLSKLTGKEFDEAYLKCMVKDHKEDVSEFKQEAKKGDDTDVKSWATTTVSTLEHHKQMAEDACKAVKGSK